MSAPAPSASSPPAASVPPASSPAASTPAPSSLPPASSPVSSPVASPSIASTPVQTTPVPSTAPASTPMDTALLSTSPTFTYPVPTWQPPPRYPVSEGLDSKTVTIVVGVCTAVGILLFFALIWRMLSCWRKRKKSAPLPPRRDPLANNRNTIMGEPPGMRTVDSYSHLKPSPSYLSDSQGHSRTPSYISEGSSSGPNSSGPLSPDTQIASSPLGMHNMPSNASDPSLSPGGPGNVEDEATAIRRARNSRVLRPMSYVGSIHSRHSVHSLSPSASFRGVPHAPHNRPMIILPEPLAPALHPQQSGLQQRPVSMMHVDQFGRPVSWVAPGGPSRGSSRMSRSTSKDRHLSMLSRETTAQFLDDTRSPSDTSHSSQSGVLSQQQHNYPPMPPLPRTVSPSANSLNEKANRSLPPSPSLSPTEPRAIVATSISAAPETESLGGDGKDVIPTQDTPAFLRQRSQKDASEGLQGVKTP